MLQSGAAPVPFITMMRPGGFKGSASFSTAGTWCIHKTAVSGQQLFSQVNILLVTTANRGYLEERGLKAQQEYNTFPEHSLTPICIRGIYILRRNFFSPECQVAFWTARSSTTLFSLHIHMYLQSHKELSLFYKEMKWKLIPHSAYHCIKWLWPPEQSAFYKDLWSSFLLWAQFPP